MINKKINQKTNILNKKNLHIKDREKVNIFLNIKFIFLSFRNLIIYLKYNDGYEIVYQRGWGYHPFKTN